jgi:histidine triad (HIT) family protein
LELNCVFCNIVNGKQPAQIVYKDELVTAFHDIQPHTPLHILIVPNRHIPSVNDLLPTDEALVGHIVTVAGRLAAEHGSAQTGYRLSINTGPDAGQSVFHLHLHLMGGRKMPFRAG